MNEDIAADLHTTISEIAQLTEPLEQYSELTEKLRRSLLAHGSSTEDNVACVNQLDVGMVVEAWGTTSTGVRLHSLNRLVSNVLWHAEGCSVPDSLRKAIPEITQSQWDACLRFVILLLTSFEAQHTPDDDTSPPGTR